MKITVIGAGAVGASWAALFAAGGHEVVLYDQALAARPWAIDRIARARPQLEALGHTGNGPVRFCDTLEEAVQDAGWVQENVREDEQIKADTLATIDRLAPPDALIGSSTSSLLWSVITARCARPDRVVIAHPFNPPHLMPLVELFGHGEAPARAAAFFASLGKHPIVMRRELKGHIANRLSSALYREAVSMVQQGAASVADIDAALCNGPGLRWAIMGAHMLYHLGGGQGGIRHYLAELGPSQERRWADLGSPSLSPDVVDRIIAGVEEEAAGRSIEELETERDTRLIEILQQRAAA
jgi:3-hydroxyacyl-CoA dehydrogenase